jgi:molecular chaperone DnaK
VDRLMREAKQHESEDRQRRELIDARNTADQLIYQMEKMLRDLGDKVQASDRGRIESIVRDLKQAKDGDDAARIKQLIEQLQQASYAVGQQMYAQQAGAQQQSAASGPQPGGDGSGQGEEEVVEGEFQEV